MTYEIVSAFTRHDLALKMTEELRRGAKPIGSPFTDPSVNQWCQAVEMPEATDLVRLKEPQRGKAKR